MWCIQIEKDKQGMISLTCGIQEAEFIETENRLEVASGGEWQKCVKVVKEYKPPVIR